MDQNSTLPPAGVDAPTTGTARPDARSGSATSGPARAAGNPLLTPHASTGATRFVLRRSRTDRMLGGVCGGIAESTGADAALLRVLLVALTLITGGAAALVYVAAWVLAPEDERPVD
jgi:phage shock protein C